MKWCIITELSPMNKTRAQFFKFFFSFSFSFNAFFFITFFRSSDDFSHFSILIWFVPLCFFLRYHSLARLLICLSHRQNESAFGCVGIFIIRLKFKWFLLILFIHFFFVLGFIFSRMEEWYVYVFILNLTNVPFQNVCCALIRSICMTESLLVKREFNTQTKASTTSSNNTINRVTMTTQANVTKKKKKFDEEEVRVKKNMLNIRSFKAHLYNFRASGTLKIFWWNGERDDRVARWKLWKKLRKKNIIERTKYGWINTTKAKMKKSVWHRQRTLRLWLW